MSCPVRWAGVPGSAAGIPPEASLPLPQLFRAPHPSSGCAPPSAQPLRPPQGQSGSSSLRPDPSPQPDHCPPFPCGHSCYFSSTWLSCMPGAPRKQPPQPQRPSPAAPRGPHPAAGAGRRGPAPSQGLQRGGPAGACRGQRPPCRRGAPWTAPWPLLPPPASVPGGAGSRGSVLGEAAVERASAPRTPVSPGPGTRPPPGGWRGTPRGLGKVSVQLLALRPQQGLTTGPGDPDGLPGSPQYTPGHVLYPSCLRFSKTLKTFLEKVIVKGQGRQSRAPGGAASQSWKPGCRGQAGAGGSGWKPGAPPVGAAGERGRGPCRGLGVPGSPRVAPGAGAPRPGAGPAGLLPGDNCSTSRSHCSRGPRGRQPVMWGVGGGRGDTRLPDTRGRGGLRAPPGHHFPFTGGETEAQAGQWAEPQWEGLPGQ